MFAMSAEAKTSARAPCSIWVTSVGVPAKLNWTLSPGWVASKDVPRAWNESLSEAAAKTERVPLSRAPGDDAAGAPVALPQAATNAVASITRTWRLRIRSPSGAGQLDHHAGGLHRCDRRDAR